MSLIDEANKRSSHRDHVIIGVWRKDDNPFRKRIGAFRPVCIVGIGFPAGPSGDRMLKFVEYPDVYLVCRAKLRDDVTHTVLHVVVVRELEHGLTDVLTEPDNGFAYHLRCPVDAVEQPRCLYTDKF